MQRALNHAKRGLRLRVHQCVRLKNIFFDEVGKSFEDDDALGAPLIDRPDVLLTLHTMYTEKEFALNGYIEALEDLATFLDHFHSETLILTTLQAKPESYDLRVSVIE